MEILSEILSINMLSSTIRMAIPLILASIGGVICERSGVINLGIEGMMLAGAFGGVYGSHITSNPWVGVLVGVLCGALFGLLHAVLCLKYKTNQSVSGIGINILVSGLTIVLVRAIWKSDGMSGQVDKLNNITINGLSEIPVIGGIFTNQSPYLYITALIVGFAWFVIYRTKTGLRLRAIGDHPQAASTVGINVTKYRYICVILSGALCGLAGAYLSIVYSNAFVKDMVAGRGYMALAAMILGAWNPLFSALASIVFAFAQALRINLQINVPNQFMLMMPYILTLVVLIVFGKNSKGPQSSGEVE